MSACMNLAVNFEWSKDWESWHQASKSHHHQVHLQHITMLADTFTLQGMDTFSVVDIKACVSRTVANVSSLTSHIPSLLAVDRLPPSTPARAPPSGLGEKLIVSTWTGENTTVSITPSSFVKSTSSSTSTPWSTLFLQSKLDIALQTSWLQADKGVSKNACVLGWARNMMILGTTKVWITNTWVQICAQADELESIRHSCECKCRSISPLPTLMATTYIEKCTNQLPGTKPVPIRSLKPHAVTMRQRENKWKQREAGSREHRSIDIQVPRFQLYPAVLRWWPNNNAAYQLV